MRTSGTRSFARWWVRSGWRTRASGTGWWRRSSSRPDGELVGAEPPPELVELGLLIAQPPLERLDRGQRHALPVDHVDPSLVRADAERRLEVLRHRPDVRRGRRIAPVAPAADRKLPEGGQDGLAVGRFEVLLQRAIGGH